MNITKNYNNLKVAKTSLDKIIEELNVDSATKARLNNISSRMQMTIISLEIEMEENK